MSAPQPEEEKGQEKGQVVPFRRRAKARAGDKTGKEPVKGLEQYSANAGPDDYRQRMTNNLLALVLCVLLIGAGIWLADTLVELRRKQDCVLSGRRDCAEISVPSADPR
jgi:hypothetical protein